MAGPTPNGNQGAKQPTTSVRYVRSVAVAGEQQDKTGAGNPPARPVSGAVPVRPGAAQAPVKPTGPQQPPQVAPPAAPNAAAGAAAQQAGVQRRAPRVSRPGVARPGGQRKRLGELLVEAGVLDEDQLDHALKIHKQTGKQLGRVLVDTNLVEESELIKYLAINLGVDAQDLNAEGFQFQADAVLLIPERQARRFNLIAFKLEDDNLHVAMANPADVIAVDTLKSITGKSVKVYIATRVAIADAIDKHYQQQYSLDQMGEDLKSVDAELVAEEEDQGGVDKEALDAASNAPVVKYVNATLMEAVKQRASDIHFEPFEREVAVRFRIDGALREVTAPPKRLYNAVVSRIKIISNLDIAERRLPQDGRCKLKVGDRGIDMRVSSLPVVHGEKVVMRILDKSATAMELESCGFDPMTLKEMKRVLNSPHGVIVLTGPTGSGKTTTLYSFLKYIFSPEINIVTVEDPVEYQLPGVNQVQVRANIGMTFASALRSILRQDPDVVMIGEMRDQETLEIAVRAALTGHLVFSTIHTNTACATVTRMADMGLERYMITSSLICAISQRLIRMICPKCKEPYTPSPALVQQLAESFRQPSVEIDLFRGKGCTFCNNSGYKGRLAVHEYMTMTPRLREMILDKRPEGELEEECARMGMRNLRQSCFMKLLDGLTTVEEAVSLFYEDH
ncbi:MAG: Flp pilus assembly complex ATPase component TadA [Planctomycetes bacterium]|nr:Flp pilus assembly complex ATPase component TadA [Planctomycetota bacterium]